ncbi:MAG TPA: tRNA 2-thiouridine(34) synthase MnmA [Bacteroidota bacterium]
MAASSTHKAVVVGMSGGVDSSVTAALLLEQGYRVIGVTMKTYDFDQVGGNVQNETSCCGLGAVNDARLVAAKLGIPHYVVDFREAFGRAVIDNFIEEYLKGRTPNPCVICNREIKWGQLLGKAEALGADCIATGHYARLRYDDQTRRYIISRGVYAQKDQSYALWGVAQSALSKTMFPLGGLTKPEVRELARKFELRNAAKDESYEICFVADNNYERFLKERVPGLEQRVEGGDVVLDGTVAGSHKGYPFYTIGQRKGLGAFGQKMYVTDIDPIANKVHVGPQKDLEHSGLVAGSVNWSGCVQPSSSMKVTAKVRYKDDDADAVVEVLDDGRIRVMFDKPKRAITPGQSVVLYRGDDLVGGGIIESIVK